MQYLDTDRIFNITELWLQLIFLRCFYFWYQKIVTSWSNECRFNAASRNNHGNQNHQKVKNVCSSCVGTGVAKIGRAETSGRSKCTGASILTSQVWCTSSNHIPISYNLWASHLSTKSWCSCYCWAILLAHMVSQLLIAS